MLKFIIKIMLILVLANSCTRKPIKNSETEYKKLTKQIDTIFQNYIDKNYINNDFLKYYDTVAVDCNQVNEIFHKVYKEDQLARTTSELNMETTDAKNQAIVISTFYKCPDIFDDLDKESKNAIFLTIQHSGDVELTAYFYRYIKKIGNKGFLALYVDRFLMRNKKPQIFGSQFITINGDWKLYKVIDRENLNHRRKIMGMVDIETDLEYFKTH